MPKQRSADFVAEMTALAIEGLGLDLESVTPAEIDDIAEAFLIAAGSFLLARHHVDSAICQGDVLVPVARRAMEDQIRMVKDQN